MKWEENGNVLIRESPIPSSLWLRVFYFHQLVSSPSLQRKENSNSDACRFVVTLRIVNKWQRSKSFENVAWSEPGKEKELFGIKGEYGKRKTIWESVSHSNSSRAPNFPPSLRVPTHIISGWKSFRQTEPALNFSGEYVIGHLQNKPCASAVALISLRVRKND